jgi:hypothetical protein
VRTLTYRLALALALSGLSALAATAQAGTLPFEDLRITPNPAAAGQPVTLLVRWSGCGPQGARSVTRAGDTVLVTQVDTTELCWATPPPPRDISYALGSFAGGQYTLRYTVNFQTTFGNSSSSVDLPFSVAGTGGGAPVETIPALSPPLLAVLAALLALAAGLGLRRRAG